MDNSSENPQRQESPDQLREQIKKHESRLTRIENKWWKKPDTVRSAPEAATQALLDRIERLDQGVRDLRNLVDSLAERCVTSEAPDEGKVSDVRDFVELAKKAVDRVGSLKKDVEGLPLSVEFLKNQNLDREKKVQRTLEEETAKNKPDRLNAVRELGANALRAREKVAKNQAFVLKAWVQGIERESQAFIEGINAFTSHQNIFIAAVAAIYRFKQQLELFDSQLPREHFEQEVQEFYDYASISYESLMGNRWHTGDPDAEDAGFSIEEACEVLEERIIRLTRVIEEDAGSQANMGGKASEGGAVKKVFDFGSGIGGPTLHMAKVTNAKIATHPALKGKVSKAYFVGVTNNGRLNARAHQRAAELGLSEFAEFVTLDDVGYKNLPRDKFPDESFDAATFFESVCHLTDKAALFHEIFRILKPGARLAGIDWIQRRFREIQTEPQIMEHMKWVNDFVRIPWHGTVEGYKDMMVNAGFEVLVAKDLWEGTECWGSTPPEDAQGWGETEGLGAELFVKGKPALDAARAAGVFSIGLWVARKPLTAR